MGAPGDNLELRREPTNEHDEKAVMVLFGGRHVGYVSKIDEVVALYMDLRRENVVGVRTAATVLSGETEQHNPVSCRVKITVTLRPEAPAPPRSSPRYLGKQIDEIS